MTTVDGPMTRAEGRALLVLAERLLSSGATRIGASWLTGPKASRRADPTTFGRALRELERSARSSSGATTS